MEKGRGEEVRDGRKYEVIAHEARCHGKTPTPTHTHTPTHLCLQLGEEVPPCLLYGTDASGYHYGEGVVFGLAQFNAAASLLHDITHYLGLAIAERGLGGLEASFLKRHVKYLVCVCVCVCVCQMCICE